MHTLNVGHPRDSRITAIDYINSHDDTLLLTGSGKG